MRTIMILSIFIALIFGCQSDRYTESAPEIESFKLLNAAIESGDFSALENIYADSALVYYNSPDAFSWQQAVAGMKESLKMFSKYEYEDGQEFEFVTTDKGEQWLGWWAIFRGTLKENGEVVRIPMHVSARFVDGKIVEETGYWDNQIITDALEEPDMK